MIEYKIKYPSSPLSPIPPAKKNALTKGTVYNFKTNGHILKFAKTVIKSLSCL